MRTLVILRSILTEHQNNQLTDALRYRATHDALTECGNRQYMEEMGIEFSHHCERMAVIALDLDDFKNINETFGHDGGDQVLKEVGSRIEEAIRPTDKVIRLGGDEFAVLLPDASLELAHRVAIRVKATIKFPMEIMSPEGTMKTIEVSASSGVASGGCDNVEGLLRDADLNQLVAKDTGKDKVIA